MFRMNDMADQPQNSAEAHPQEISPQPSPQPSPPAASAGQPPASDQPSPKRPRKRPSRRQPPAPAVAGDTAPTADSAPPAAEPPLTAEALAMAYPQGSEASTGQDAPEAAPSGDEAPPPTEAATAAPSASQEVAPEDDEVGDEHPVEADPQSQQELAEHEITTQQVVEALLFASDTPLTLQKIVSLVGVGSARDVRNHIDALNKRYEKIGATFRIEKIAGGYQMLTLPAFNTWLRRLKQSRQESRFSPAALETLAVVAYKQPVVRAEIEAIRGVSAGEMLNRLRELGLVKIVGRAEDVGRPMLYGTTKKFLEVFGLSGVEDLPQVEQLQPPGS